ncbi:MAG: hypothetical protein FWG64_12960 [Firmicutes bacterium]|nr:hypothetical protein [Bacillota bacterium]
MEKRKTKDNKAKKSFLAFAFEFFGIKLTFVTFTETSSNSATSEVAEHKEKEPSKPLDKVTQLLIKAFALVKPLIEPLLIPIFVMLLSRLNIV